MLPTQRIMSKAFLERGRTDVVKWELLPIPRTCRHNLVFENWTKTHKHGVWLRTDGELIVNGTSSPSMNLWADETRQTVDIDVPTSSGLLHLYNIWDFGQRSESQSWSSGMLVEELPDGRRYRCNDIGFETEFDSLVFRIEITGNTPAAAR